MANESNYRAAVAIGNAITLGSWVLAAAILLHAVIPELWMDYRRARAATEAQQAIEEVQQSLEDAGMAPPAR